MNETPGALPAVGLTLLLLLGPSQATESYDPPVAGDPTDSPAPAERSCALCEKPIAPGEEVFLDTDEAGSTAYRCVHCALTAQAATEQPSSIRTRSPLSDAPITIRHDLDGWSVTPASTVFLSLPEEGGECMDRHRAFSGPDEYEHYLEAHPELSADTAVPYRIEQIAELLAAGLPPDGIRPDAPVQLLVVGMVSHLPFRESVLPAIEGALADVGDRVGARFVDATRPEGRALLSVYGIDEHLPVVMFLDGSSRAEVDGTPIDLRGFPGSSWTREGLAAVLRRAASH
jgi:hypothetical protein